MGLVNRVVPDGGALDAALALAAELSALPQACLRHDRLSALEQWDLAEPDAIVNEVDHGLERAALGRVARGCRPLRERRRAATAGARRAESALEHRDALDVLGHLEEVERAHRHELPAGVEQDAQVARERGGVAGHRDEPAQRRELR